MFNLDIFLFSSVFNLDIFLCSSMFNLDIFVYSSAAALLSFPVKNKIPINYAIVEVSLTLTNCSVTSECVIK